MIDWLSDSWTHDASRHRAVPELLGQTRTPVLGRRVYEGMVRAWPATQSPMAEHMNALPKVVFSSTLATVEWNNARVSDRPVAEQIPEFKRQAGKDIVVFGAPAWRDRSRARA